MRKLFDKIWNDERGNVLVVMGATLPLFIGAAGLATDTIQWTLWKRQLQRAADSAAIAGVYERVQVGSDQTAVETAVDKDLALNHHTGIAFVTGYPAVSLPADSGDLTLQVQVSLAVERPLSFSGMFMTNAPQITATSTAASVPGSDQYCVVALEDTAVAGITGTGDAKIEMDCGMISNSTAPNAAIAQGSSSMDVSVIASVGGIEKSDNWVVDKYDPYVAKQDDPYASLNPDPNDMRCDAYFEKKKGNGTEWVEEPMALEPGVDLSNIVTKGGNQVNCFSSLSVGPGETLALDPGVYYISGGDVHIQGTLTGTDVTIVLTNHDTDSDADIGDFDVNADAKMQISAPTDSGNKWRGIAVYQDRRATTNTNQYNNKINGDADNWAIGVLYFPSTNLQYNGGGTTDFICTRVVSRRVKFAGNATITNKFAHDCESAGIDSIEGGRLIRLVA